jgi:hypothetical protein
MLTKLPPMPLVSPFCLESLAGGSMFPWSGYVHPSQQHWDSFQSLAWPTTNLAVFIPFTVGDLVIPQKMTWFNGNTVSGNVDAGLYDANGVRLYSTGSIAASGTNVYQYGSAISGVILVPGKPYYLAMAADNTTYTNRAHNFHTTATAAVRALSGIMQQTSAFALPATATFAAYGSDFIPMVGFTTTPTRTTL